MLTYGHGDVVLGYDAQWRSRTLAVDADRRGRPLVWPRHGRQQGSALDQSGGTGARARRARTARLQREAADGDRRGNGLPGPARACERERAALAADVFIASDGPRLRAERPTLFLGSRGAFNFDLTVDLARRRPSLRQLGRSARQSRERSSRTRSPRSSMRAGASSSKPFGRRRFPTRCAARSPTSSRANRPDPRSTPTGASPG